MYTHRSVASKVRVAKEPCCGDVPDSGIISAENEVGKEPAVNPMKQSRPAVWSDLRSEKEGERGGGVPPDKASGLLACKRRGDRSVVDTIRHGFGTNCAEACWRSACEEAEPLRGEVGAEARPKHKIGNEMK